MLRQETHSSLEAYASDTGEKIVIEDALRARMMIQSQATRSRPAGAGGTGA
jgi:hypothetical protein